MHHLHHRVAPARYIRYICFHPSFQTRMVNWFNLAALLGPKAQALFWLVLLWWCVSTTLSMSSFQRNIHAKEWWPEGSCSSIKAGEVQTTWTPQHAASTKPDGTRPISVAVPLPSCARTCAPRKKAYARALKRAALRGMTWYRGRYLSAQQLGVTTISSQLNANQAPHFSTGQDANEEPHAGGIVVDDDCQDVSLSQAPHLVNPSPNLDRSTQHGQTGLDQSVAAQPIPGLSLPPRHWLEL